MSILELLVIIFLMHLDILQSSKGHIFLMCGEALGAKPETQDMMRNAQAI